MTYVPFSRFVARYVALKGRVPCMTYNVLASQALVRGPMADHSDLLRRLEAAVDSRAG